MRLGSTMDLIHRLVHRFMQECRSGRRQSILPFQGCHVEVKDWSMKDIFQLRIELHPSIYGDQKLADGLIIFFCSYNMVEATGLSGRQPTRSSIKPSSNCNPTEVGEGSS